MFVYSCSLKIYASEFTTLGKHFLHLFVEAFCLEKLEVVVNGKRSSDYDEWVKLPNF